MPKRLLVGVTAMTLLAGAAWYAASVARRDRRLNVLLITIDTLRADHLGSYGYAPAQTPALDALAARGLRFAQATTVAPLTLPAHASLMTGTFPAYHGIRDNGGFYLDDGQVTLAKTLRARGYRTGGFVSAFVLDGRWGIGQGFDRYFDEFDLAKFRVDIGLDAVQRPGGETVSKAIEWLDQDPARPFLAWVHLYEPHAPYDAPEPIRVRFPPTMLGAYDAEIATVDIQVARLIDHVAAAGRLDRTVVIVLGDHGESLGEHGEEQHAFFVYDATVRIPLIMAGPGLPARVVTDQVRIIDVMPTLLEVLGVDVPKAVQGRSLLPLARGERLDLVALSETWYPRHHYGWSELTAIRDGRYHFIAAPRRELYDTQTDPGETHNLAQANASRTDAQERALLDLVARTSATHAAPAPRPVDPDVEQRLQALGYVGSSISPRALEERPRGDPKDKIALYNLLKQAGLDSVEGRIDEGISKVRQALSADPEIVEAFTMLGNMHGKANRQKESVAAYQQALALDPENQAAAFNLALAYKTAGRIDDSEAGFRRVLDLNPRDVKSTYQLADIWMQRGEFAKAEDALRHALTGKVERTALLTKLGECDIELKRYDDAERSLLEALKGKPDEPRAHYDLGLIYDARGEPARAITEYEAEIARNPKTYQAQFNLAKLLIASGRTADAVRHFEQAVDANPEFGSGFLYLAKARLDVGDLDGAEAAATKGMTLKPDADIAPLGHFVLADVYSRRGRPLDAAREAAKGRKLELRRAS
ncbi:MAG TPA: sulfatase-like hydrolase/transferase [Vicinamibacterales bacterium]|nr:sulfatase-like hydrolase/transferase [Vicinamibacterales bacterium]